jgi:hypothetical protein
MGVPRNEADDDDNYDKKEEETSNKEVAAVSEANAASTIRSMEGELAESKTIRVEEVWIAQSEEHQEEHSASTLSSSTERSTTEQATEAVPKTALKESVVTKPPPPPPRHALNEEVRNTATRRRSSFLSSGEIFARAPRRVNRPKSMEEFLDRVRKKSGLAHDDDDSEDDHTSTEVERKQKPVPLHTIKSRRLSSSGRSTPKLSVEDIEICQRLDEEYERALEEREIGYNARYSSVRQTAVFSVFFMFTYLFLGTVFFMRQAAWTIADSLLFSIYTITTVGYGQMGLPTTPGFQAYTIFYILVGIAALTIMVCFIKYMHTYSRRAGYPLMLTNMSFSLSKRAMINRLPRSTSALPWRRLGRSMHTTKLKWHGVA